MVQLLALQLLGAMTLEQKVGQLLMMPVPISFTEAAVPTWLQKKGVDTRLGDRAYLQHLFTTYHVGGVIFLYRGKMAEEQATIAQFNALNTSKIPLMVAHDLEPGFAAAKNLRPELIGLTDAPQVPCAAELGTRDDQEVFQAGKTVAQCAKKMGVSVIFAPVVDVNSNPKNPIIGKRAFGTTPELVTQKAGAFMRGIQSEGIRSVIKHAPGHGDTNFDSHSGLGTIAHNWTRLEQVELAPFRTLAPESDGVMLAHLNVPAIDPTLPTSLSSKMVELLRSYQMRGLIFTDAMDMKAMDRTNPGLPELQAVLAGAHIVVVPYDLPAAHARIVAAVQSGKFPETELNQRVMEIMLYKFQAHIS